MVNFAPMIKIIVLVCKNTTLRIYAYDDDKDYLILMSITQRNYAHTLVAKS